MSNEKFDFPSDLDLSGFDGKGSEKDYLRDVQEKISHAQISMVYSLFSELGIDKSDVGIAKVSELTKAEASLLIEQLLAMKEEKEQEEFDEDYEFYYGEVGEDLDF